MIKDERYVIQNSSFNFRPTGRRRLLSPGLSRQLARIASESLPLMPMTMKSPHGPVVLIGTNVLN
jgi:hypothetical protein